MMLILRDLNAKVGSENTGREHVVGKHGIGSINDNGEKLVEFCEENNLSNTFTKQPGYHQTGPLHITINQKWRSSLQDVRAYRGADVASDQTLVLANISL
jgi:hypothetical protein